VGRLGSPKSSPFLWTGERGKRTRA
jgi:hypothetical protein